MSKQNLADDKSTATQIPLTTGAQRTTNVTFFRPFFSKKQQKLVPSNRGEAIEYEDFDSLTANLIDVLAEYGVKTGGKPIDAVKGGLPAFAPAEFEGNKRSKATCERVTLSVGDHDGETEESWAAAVALLEALGVAWFAYGSPKDGIAKPDKPNASVRRRLLIALSRDVDATESERLRAIVPALLGLSPDASTVGDESRLFYAGHVDDALPYIDGSPSADLAIDVDAILAAHPEAAPKARAPRAKTVGGPMHEPSDDADPVVALVRHEWESGERHPINRALGSKLAQLGWDDARIAGIFWTLGCDRLGPEHRVGQAIEAAHMARAYYRTDPAPAGAICPPGWDVLCERFGVEGAQAIKDAAKDPRMPDDFKGVWSERWAAIEERAAKQRAEQDAANREKASAQPAADTAAPDESAPPTRSAQGCDPEVDYVIQHISPAVVGVFQRAGKLSCVTREAHDDRGIVRPAGNPTIRDLPLARLKEIIRMRAGHARAQHAGDVMARGEWDLIRPLDAIVSYPVMRRDGSLLLASGYDAATRTLAEMRVSVDVPDAPTLADARTALATLTGLVSDFPFAGDAHRSSWLAALLTVPARPAIDGPTPMLLLDASARGSGKTLLADVISIIVTGEPAPRRTAPETAEEWRKVIFAMLLAGDPICLIDNVTRMLASAALDAMLTGTTYQDRVLGVSEERRIPVRTVMIASANNCRVSTDLVRRSVHCRLEPDVEHPESRTGFRFADLLGHVRHERVALLGATLTIVRAYAVAGRPRVAARPMGSYEAWCRVVRDALVWAGAADPAATQDGLSDDADVERDELRDLLTAWHSLLADRAVTTRELIESVHAIVPGTGVQDPGGKFGGRTPEQQALLDALRGIMPSGAEPTAHAVANRLRTLRNQITGGLALRQAEHGDSHAKVKRWQVR